MISWLDGLVAGAIAGLVQGMFAMIVAGMRGQPFTWPLTNIGYMFRPATNQPARGHPGTITKGLMIHMLVAMMLGLVFALIAPFLPAFLPLWVWGMVYAALIWLLDIAGLLRLVDPTMKENFSMGVFFLTHLVFGAVLGWWLQVLPINL
jgi:hypothetical protein